MLTVCPDCGKYTVETPCYQCVAAERDKYRRLSATDADRLAAERDKYRQLYELALGACPRCQENCAVRRLGAPRATGA